MSGVLVYSEDLKLQLQLLGKGRDLAEKLGSRLFALIIGSDVSASEKEVQNYADEVFVVEDRRLGYADVELYKTAALEPIKRADPEIILIGATKFGKELAPRIAAALKAGCMTDCISLDMGESGGLIAERLTYGGSSIAREISSRRRPHIATVPKRVFEMPNPMQRTGSVSRLQVDLPQSRVKVVERREKRRSDAGLEDASIIVSAGRGFRNRDDLKLLEELSSILGAKIGCTRPIAADSGWLEEWIGISGKKVKPRFYIACGISGTVQHAAGIRDSQIIVAVNQDESAGIFELSDYGVVGDLYTVLPALIKALKEKAK